MNEHMDQPEGLLRFEHEKEGDTKLIELTNHLLEYVGISSKKVGSIDELVRVSSSLFVAVFEALFHIRVNGIIRSPKSQRDYTINAQLIIDCLSQQIRMDLRHITGEAIVRGDLQSISNLVNILFRIVGLTRTVSEADDIADKFGASLRSDNSLSTHDSDFDFGSFREFYEEEPLVEDSVLQFSDDLMATNDILRRSQTNFELERKLEEAASRRSRLRKIRESTYATSNQRKLERSRSALHRKSVDDLRKVEKSYLLKKSSEEHVMLRKVYSGLVKRMHGWKSEDLADAKERRKMEAKEALEHRQSIDNLFQERLRMVKEQAESIEGRDDHLLRSQRKMLSEVLRSQRERQERMMRDSLEQLAHRRERSSVLRREAHEDLLAVLSVSSWKDMLRHDVGGRLTKKQSRRRAASAPSSSTRRRTRL